MQRCKHNKLRLQQQNFALVEYLFPRFSLLLKYLLKPFPRLSNSCFAILEAPGIFRVMRYFAIITHYIRILFKVTEKDLDIH